MNTFTHSHHGTQLILTIQIFCLKFSYYRLSELFYYLLIGGSNTFQLDKTKQGLLKFSLVPKPIPWIVSGIILHFTKESYSFIL